jgi:hypothetical protein
MIAWNAEELQQIGAARELEIASRRADGTLRSWVPIWVVTFGDQVYVRTWYRRDTGWFGRVLASGQARIRVPALETDVTVEDTGEGTPELRAGIDAAYRTKYGPFGGTERMITAEAAAATLRLRRLAADSLDSHLGGARTLISPGRVGPATRELAWKRSASASSHGGPAFH